MCVFALSRRPCICIIFTIALYCMCRCLVISGTSKKLLRVTPTTAAYYSRGAFDLKIELRNAGLYRRALLCSLSRSKIMITNKIFDVQFSTLYARFVDKHCVFTGDLLFYVRRIKFLLFFSKVRVFSLWFIVHSTFSLALVTMLSYSV